MWRILKYFNLIKTNIIFDTLRPYNIPPNSCFHMLLHSQACIKCHITPICMSDDKPREDSKNFAKIYEEISGKIEDVITLSNTIAQRYEKTTQLFDKCWARLEQLNDKVSNKLDLLVKQHQKAEQIERKKTPQPVPRKRATRQQTRSRSRDVQKPAKKDKLMAQLKKGLKSVHQVAKELRVSRKKVQKWAKE